MWVRASKKLRLSHRLFLFSAGNSHSAAGKDGKNLKHVLLFLGLQRCECFILAFASAIKQLKGSGTAPRSLERRRLSGLQVVTEPLYLIDEEVDVRLGNRRVGDDHSEEVYFIALRLVAHHGGPRLHHHGLDLWCHLLE